MKTMLTIKQCLVLQERPAGDAGKFIDILTKKHGILEVFVRGKQKNTGNALAATQRFSYSKMCIQERNGSYYFESAEPLYLFYSLRKNLEHLALADYFIELLRIVVPCGEQQNFVLRLTLNVLYYLSTGKREAAFLKSLFELRLLSELGFMPDVLICPVCYAHLPEQLVYSVQDGHFYCKNCYQPERAGEPAVAMPLGGLHAVRHIVLSDPDRLFHFRMNAGTQAAVGAFAEQFVQYHLHCKPKTLEFYKQITNLK